MCGTFPETKFINYKCFDMRLPRQCGRPCRVARACAARTALKEVKGPILASFWLCLGVCVCVCVCLCVFVCIRLYLHVYLNVYVHAYRVNADVLVGWREHVPLLNPSTKTIRSNCVSTH